MDERTEWQGQNESQIGAKEKWQTCWCCRDQQKACRMVQASVEKLYESRSSGILPSTQYLTNTNNNSALLTSIDSSNWIE